MEVPTGAKSQQYAVRIEHKLCKIFNCDRLGIGGMVNSDFINSMPYGTMVATLMFLFKDKEVNIQKEIEIFISDYYFYSNRSIDEIIDEEEQGEIKFKEMMNKFLELVK